MQCSITSCFPARVSCFLLQYPAWETLLKYCIVSHSKRKGLLLLHILGREYDSSSSNIKDGSDWITHMYTNGTLKWPGDCDVNSSYTGIVGSDSSQSLVKSLTYLCVCTWGAIDQISVQWVLPNTNKQDLEKATFKVVTETLIKIQVFWDIKAVWPDKWLVTILKVKKSL